MQDRKSEQCFVQSRGPGLNGTKRTHARAHMGPPGLFDE